MTFLHTAQRKDSPAKDQGCSKETAFLSEKIESPNSAHVAPRTIGAPMVLPRPPTSMSCDPRNATV